MKEPSSTKTADLQPAGLLEMSPPSHGNSPTMYLKLNEYFKENPWMTASKYTIYNTS